MKNTRKKRNQRLTEGQRQRLFGATLVLFVTAASALWLAFRSEFQNDLDLSVAMLLCVPFLATVSAGAALYIAIPWFGSRGLLGIARLLLGGFIATMLTVGFSVIGIVVLSNIGLGTAISAMVSADWGIVPALWFVSLIQFHRNCIPYCTERQSIYQVRLSGSDNLPQFSVLSRLALPETLGHQRAKWMGY